MINSGLFTILFSVFFLLHNLEEYLSFDKNPKIYQKTSCGLLKNRTVFAYAAIFISIVVIAILTLNIFFKNVRPLATLVILSILINAVQHVILSLCLRRVVPGLLTACFLIIPFSIVALTRSTFPSWKSLLVYGATSLVVMYSITILSLLFGNYIFSKRCSSSKF